VSVVSCRFLNSITTTCYGLAGRVTNKSATSWQLPRLQGSYEETCVMDYGRTVWQLPSVFVAVSLYVGGPLGHVKI